jgi:hypothetical protein
VSAEGVGFEPTVGEPTPVFKTGTFVRSVIPPETTLIRHRCLSSFEIVRHGLGPFLRTLPGAPPRIGHGTRESCESGSGNRRDAFVTVTARLAQRGELLPAQDEPV